jgi:protein-S-isoprenylcysteine O-methyltransferase Ste14
MAVIFHLFVTSYEEPALRRRFGATDLQYRRMVPRWIPRPPRRGRASPDQQRNPTNK